MVLLSKSTPHHPNVAIQKITQEAIHQGVLRRRDHFALTAAMLCDSSLAPAIRSDINRVLDYIRMGRVVLVD